MPGGPPPRGAGKMMRGGSAQDLRKKEPASPHKEKALRKRASSGNLYASTVGGETSAIARVAAFAAAGRASLSPSTMTVVSRMSDDERSQAQTRQSMHGAGFFWRTTAATSQPTPARSARGSEDLRPKSSMLSARPDLSAIELPPRARSAMGGLAGLAGLSGAHQMQASALTAEPAAQVPDYMNDDYEESDRSSVEVKAKRKSFKQKDPYEKTMKDLEDYAQYMEDCTSMLEDRLQMHIPPNLQQALTEHRERGAQAAQMQLRQASGELSARNKSVQRKSAAAERLDEKLNEFLGNHKR
eukprot:2893631-Rhodomonas_salina.2